MSSHWPIDVSVVMPLHRESLLVHRTLKSAEAAIDHAQSAGVTCELITVLDCADAETRRYVQQFPSRLRRELEVEVGDPGLARNHGVEIARGRYIAFMDGDDLLGVNWLTAAWNYAQREPQRNSILHPEYNVVFDAQDCYTRYRSSRDHDFSPLQLVACNLWTIFLFFPRNLFDARQFRFISRQSSRRENYGYAYEDWHWIAEQLALGQHIDIVPDTCNFIRRKTRDSILALDRNGEKLLPPTSALRPDFYGPNGDKLVPSELQFERRRPVLAIPTLPSCNPGRQDEAICGRANDGRFTHSVQKRLNWIRHKVIKTSKKIWRKGEQYRNRAHRLKPDEGQQIIIPPARISVPRWLWDVAAEAHRVDPKFFPSNEKFDRFVDCTLSAPLQAATYFECCQYIRRNPTHVILAPWLKTGGADLETLNYARAIVEASPNNHVLVIATENTDSPWARRLPSTADFLPFGLCTCNSSLDEQRRILGTLLVQSGPRTIQNMNSALGYQVFAASGPALRNQSRLYCSVFCEDYFPDGRIAGYAMKEVPECFEYLDGIFADNRRILDLLQDYFGLLEDRIFVHYQPIDDENPINRQRRNNVFEVLWAGRLDRQKRPDILAQIAQRLAREPVRFAVYGSALLGGDEAVSQLAAMPNVQFRGPYSSFGDLPLAEFDLLLHTAQWEGMPNVLLEAMTRGLPVMAADVGGVSELIRDGETGVLISPFDDVDQYCDRLRELIRRRQVLTTLGQAGKAEVRRRHSWPAFYEALARVPGYLANDSTCELLKVPHSSSRHVLANVA